MEPRLVASYKHPSPSPGPFPVLWKTRGKSDCKSEPTTFGPQAGCRNEKKKKKKKKAASMISARPPHSLTHSSTPQSTAQHNTAPFLPTQPSPIPLGAASWTARTSAGPPLHGHRRYRSHQPFSSHAPTLTQSSPVQSSPTILTSSTSHAPSSHIIRPDNI